MVIKKKGNRRLLVGPENTRHLGFGNSGPIPRGLRVGLGSYAGRGEADTKPRRKGPQGRPLDGGLTHAHPLPARALRTCAPASHSASEPARQASQSASVPVSQPARPLAGCGCWCGCGWCGKSRNALLKPFLSELRNITTPILMHTDK